MGGGAQEKIVEHTLEEYNPKNISKITILPFVTFQRKRFKSSSQHLFSDAFLSYSIGLSPTMFFQQLLGGKNLRGC